MKILNKAYFPCKAMLTASLILLLFSASSCTNDEPAKPDEPNGPESPITPGEPTLPAGAVTWSQPLSYTIENGEVGVSCESDTVTALDIPAEIILNGHTTYPVTWIYGLNCESLLSLRIPISIKTVWEYAFSNTNIKDLYIDDLEAWCGIDFRIPDTKRYMRYKESNPIQPDTRFYVKGQPIDSLTIPKTIEKVKALAFTKFSCSHVEFHKGVTSIDTAAFMSCSKLTEVNFPEGMVEIAKWAFADCTSLKQVTLPSTIVKVMGPFDRCDALKDIYIKAPIPPAEFILFNFNTISGFNGVTEEEDNRTLYRQVTLHVPKGSLSLYKKDRFPYNLFEEIVEWDFDCD